LTCHASRLHRSISPDLKQRTFRVDSPHEHCGMLATVLKHSCYYIVNRSYINQPEFTSGRDEISARFYEGAAAATVMIGEAPRTEEFKRQFDWPDAVILCRSILPILAVSWRTSAVTLSGCEQFGATMLERPRSGTTGCIEFGRCSIPSALRPPRRCVLARNGSTGSLHRHRP